jgi:PAS domain S-box-containing protein
MRQKMHGLWARYKSDITNSVFTGHEFAPKDIIYWKNKVFCNILVYFLPVSIISLVPGIIMSFKTGIPLLGIYDLLAFGTILFVAFVPGIRLPLRKLIFITVVYCLTIILLYYLGSFGPAMMYLLALTVLTSIIGSYRAAYFTVFINAAICVVAGLLIEFEPVGSKLVYAETLGAWIAVSSNVVLLSVVCAACLNLMIKGFEKTLLNAETSEKRFRSMIEKGNEIIALHDREGKLMYMSQSITSSLGYLPENRVGLYAFDAIHPDDRPHIKKILDKLMATPGAVSQAQWRHKHADGSWIWMDGVATNLLDDPAVNAVVHNFRDITAQKEAEEKVRAERNLLRTLVDNIPDAIYVKDKFGRKILSNAGDLKLLGAIAEPEVLGKTSLELFPGQQGTDSYNDDLDIIRTGKSYINREAEIINSKGDFIWVLNTKMPIRNEKGEITGVLGINRDITDRRQMEIDLRKSNERFEYVSQATFDAIWDWDLLTGQVYWGKGFEVLFGFKTENLEMNSRKFSEFIHPDERDKVLQAIHNLINSKEVNWGDEYRFLKSDGSYAYVRDKGIVVRDESGQATRMIGAMQDITQKKTEEQQLQLLESVITHATDAVIITEAEPLDLPGPRIVYVNEAVTKLTGYSKAELIGATPRILQGEDTNRKELERLKTALKKWEPCQIEVKNYRKNGEVFWNNMSIVPIADENGWFTHWISIERDVTERKLVEEELREKNSELKRLSTYLQSIREEERKYIAREVHDELGQLATALKIDIDWLNLKVVTLEASAKNRMVHAIKTIEVLISSIRKIASRLRPSVLDDFGLNAALQWHCAEFQSLNGIQCSFEPGFDDLGITMEMKTEMFRMTQESLTNVMRHAHATEVHVTTGEDDKNLYLTVSDNGDGFDTGKRKNTLGLIGLRERAVSLNGVLNIESGIGKGTTISAVIPKNKSYENPVSG